MPDIFKLPLSHAIAQALKEYQILDYFSFEMSGEIDINGFMK